VGLTRYLDLTVAPARGARAPRYAFAFDALQLEVSFIAGPLLAAALAASLSPQAALL
jgi:hypothetical protein